MKHLLNRLGFTYPALGRPLTEMAMRHNRRIIRRLVLSSLGTAAAGAGRVFAARHFPGGAAAEFLNAAGGVLLCGGLIFTLYFSYHLDSTLLEVVDDGLCPKLRSWAETHPEIHAHIAAINAQSRAITLSDWAFLGCQIELLEEEKRKAETRAACLALHAMRAP